LNTLTDKHRPSCVVCGHICGFTWKAYQPPSLQQIQEKQDLKPQQIGVQDLDDASEEAETPFLGGMAHLNSMNYCEDDQEYLEMQRAKTSYTQEPYDICLHCF
jgi:hypothetical protein